MDKPEFDVEYDFDTFAEKLKDLKFQEMLFVGESIRNWMVAMGIDTGTMHTVGIDPAAICVHLVEMADVITRTRAEQIDKAKKAREADGFGEIKTGGEGGS